MAAIVDQLEFILFVKLFAAAILNRPGLIVKAALAAVGVSLRLITYLRGGYFETFH